MTTGITTSAGSASLSERIFEQLDEMMGKGTLRRNLLTASAIEVVKGVVQVSAPNTFAAERITRRLSEALRTVAREQTGDPDTTVQVRVDPACAVSAGADDRSEGAVDLCCDGATRGEKELFHAASRSGEGAGRTRRAQPISIRQRRLGRHSGGELTHTLDTFVIGPCNELAYRAALELTEDERATVYHIVFVHGECGVGKTHLLQGALDRFRRNHHGARVLYTTGEAFTNAFVTAVRDGGVAGFRRRHRGLDLLCIDDVHFLSNKTQTQSEFLHTFDSMDLDGARIMLASDEPPTRIGRFSRELVSRFSAGMVVSLEAPDHLTRRRLVEAFAHRRGLMLTEDAINLIARRCEGSVREIEGALTRLDAVERLLPDGAALSGPIDSVRARLSLGAERSARACRPIKVEAILECITTALGVSVPEMLGKSRHARVVTARSLTAYLSRRLTSRSFPEIAQAMGRPNHSTVVTACKRVEKKIADGDRCDRDLDVNAETWAELVDEMERIIRRSFVA